MSDPQGTGGPGSDPQMRASDADREATVLILNKAFSDGRLTNAEHEQRMTAAYAAVTMGDLTKLTADLPTMSSPPPPPGPPATSAHTPNEIRGQYRNSPLRAQWLSWLGLSLFMIAIWLISGFSGDGFEFYYFWPFWVIVPTGIFLAVRTFSGDQR